MLRQSGIHHQIAQRVKVVVIAAKARTGMQILADQHQWVRRMSHETRLPCCCELCPAEWPMVLGHKTCRSRVLFPWSLRTPLVEDPRAVGKEAVRAIWKAGRRYLPSRALVGVKLCWKGSLIDRDGLALVERNCGMNAPADCTTSAVLEMKRRLVECVKVPIDKSPGELLVCCPAYYEDLYDKAFNLDGEYYDMNVGCPTKVVLDMRRTFKERGWNMLGGWNGKGEFPVPYVMPKNKDLQRARPIAPYTHHYLKRVYKTVSRAHCYTIRRLDEQDTFNIVCMSEFGERVRRGLEDGAGRFGDRLKWRAQCGDLANMYTELRHDVISEAVVWGLERFRKRVRADRVTVSRRSREVHAGRAYGPGSVEVPLDLIAEVTAYDIRHMFMWIKDKLARQQHGCPMGSPTSPPEAMITCSLAEAELMSRMVSGELLLVVARYMDDVFMLVGYDGEDTQQEQSAVELSDEVLRIYPRPLVMEATDPVDGSFKFLESLVRVEGNRISVRHFNPNCEHPGHSNFAPDRLELHQQVSDAVLSGKLLCEWHKAGKNSIQWEGLFLS